MTVADEDLEVWQRFVGRQRRLEQQLDTESVLRFAVACGSCGELADLPPIVHWAWFLPVVSDEGLGLDGHPRRGGFLPPVTLPRRMFAGSSIRFEAPLELDAPAVLEETIASVEHKQGRTGDLVFVSVKRTLLQESQVRITEQQSIVYRESGDRVALPAIDDGTAASAQWQPDTISLFRFSAVTFNAHRIHYDRPYAVEEEGYPSLVVHGPFAASRLAAFAIQERGAPLLEFNFKGLAPLFVDQPVRFVAQTEQGHFAAIRCDGIPALTATAHFSQ